MIRLLVKKQLVEIFRGYLYNAKKNKARSHKATTAMIAGFILLTLLLSGGMFGMLAYTLAGPFCAVGMDWLLFLILGLLALVFGCFGSVFNTFHGLYLASDHDLLLSISDEPDDVVREILAFREENAVHVPNKFFK
jgi:ABC-2 type transport system permease protein